MGRIVRVAITAAMAALAAASPADGSRAADAERWLERLVGRWTTVATHHLGDGGPRVEQGEVSCGWILNRTAIHCDRRHRSSSGGLRVSIQIWQADGSRPALQVDTYTAGRFGQVIQRSTELSPASVTLTATIPWRSGRANTRSKFSAEGSGLHYRNETEEAPGQWRLDFDERWQLVSRAP